MNITLVQSVGEPTVTLKAPSWFFLYIGLHVRDRANEFHSLHLQVIMLEKHKGCSTLSYWTAWDPYIVLAQGLSFVFTPAQRYTLFSNQNSSWSLICYLNRYIARHDSGPDPFWFCPFPSQRRHKGLINQRDAYLLYINKGICRWTCSVRKL